MTRKEKLLIEIYRLKNMIAEVKGNPQIHLEQLQQTPQFDREAKNSREYRLKEQIESLQQTYQNIVEQKSQDDRREAYYATPEGAAHKARLEETIKKKVAERREMSRQTTESVENRIRQLLGAHWGVKYFDRGILCIGVIDFNNSCSEQRKFIFGQEITIRYEEQDYWSDAERFGSDCNGAGSFSMQGGSTIGERAMFYVGIGKLYGDSETVEWLRITMRDYNRAFDRFRQEMNSLRFELSTPISKEEAR